LNQCKGDGRQAVRQHPQAQDLQHPCAMNGEFMAEPYLEEVLAEYDQLGICLTQVTPRYSMRS
jgi:hypothetical protein